MAQEGATESEPPEVARQSSLVKGTVAHVEGSHASLEQKRIEPLVVPSHAIE